MGHSCVGTDNVEEPFIVGDELGGIEEVIAGVVQLWVALDDDQVGSHTYTSCRVGSDVVLSKGASKADRLKEPLRTATDGSW